MGVCIKKEEVRHALVMRRCVVLYCTSVGLGGVVSCLLQQAQKERK